MNKDKLLHFCVSLCLVILLSFLDKGIISVGLIVLSIGFLKEMWDSIKPKSTGFSWMDIVADTGGILVGSLFVILMRFI